MRVGLGSLVVIALLASAGCTHEPVAVRPASVAEKSSGVTVTRVSGGVQFSNNTSNMIGFLIWNPNWLGLLSGIPCTEESWCLHVAAGATVVVADADITGWVAGAKEAIARWWPLTTDGGHLKAGEVTELHVTL